MNWRDCSTIADITQYVTQAQSGDPIAQAWREMLEDTMQWSIAFTLDDFIKVGYWRSEPTQAKVKSLQDAVEQAVIKWDALQFWQRG